MRKVRQGHPHGREQAQGAYSGKFSSNRPGISWKPHLFIAGAPRCGTSALFDHLAGHPQIARCHVKEPGFLYPQEFRESFHRSLPPDVKPRFEAPATFTDGLQAYEALFESAPTHGEPAHRLEASAHYLYSPAVPERIRDHFPRARVVLILREPIRRLISDFHYARLLRCIPWDTSFSAYLAMLRQQPNDDSPRPLHLWALGHGRYSLFVERYLRILGRDRVFVTWAESLKSDPAAVMRRLCSFAGLSADYFEDIEYRTKNASVSIRRPRLFAIAHSLRALHTRHAAQGRPGLPLRALNRLIARPLMRLAVSATEDVTLSQMEREFLASYYADEADRLESLVGIRPPW